MAQAPSSLGRHMLDYAAVCTGFLLAGSALCGSSDSAAQETGRDLVLATLFSGTFWSAVRITGENIRTALADEKPHP